MGWRRRPALYRAPRPLPPARRDRPPSRLTRRERETLFALAWTALYAAALVALFWWLTRWGGP
jgi:ferric-dicitrate binding protein FerR (iron transport regulator)